MCCVCVPVSGGCMHVISLFACQTMARTRTSTQAARSASSSAHLATDRTAGARSGWRRLGTQALQEAIVDWAVEWLAEHILRRELRAGRACKRQRRAWIRNLADLALEDMLIRQRRVVRERCVHQVAVVRRILRVRIRNARAWRVSRLGNALTRAAVPVAAEPCGNDRLAAKRRATVMRRRLGTWVGPEGRYP